MTMKTRFPGRRQRGATLVIGMIMLVLITLFVLAAVNMSTINLRVMGNTQARNESISAAQQAIEQIASTDFPKNPQPATVNVDVNGDTVTDYTVAIATPVCLNSIPIKVTELNALDSEDVKCFSTSAGQNTGVVGAGWLGGGGNSVTVSNMARRKTITLPAAGDAAVAARPGNCVSIEIEKSASGAERIAKSQPEIQATDISVC